MKDASLYNYRGLLTAVSITVLALAGCASPGLQDNDLVQTEKSTHTITGSRIPIRDTSAAIGVKTVDHDEIDRMMRSNPGRSN
jgi:hypothetical protein